MNQLHAYIAASVPCAVLLWFHLKKTRHHHRLPPSPNPDPLIGNLRAMMNIVDEPRAYRDWGLELGSDIISITIPGQVIIVLNSQEAVSELLVKRSSIYSDRPQIPMVSSDRLAGWGNFIAVLGYGEKWRFQRKVIHEALQKNANEARWPLIDRDSRFLLQRILANPRNFSQDLRRMTGSTLLAAVYGYEATSLDDSLFKMAENASQGFLQAVVVPNFLVNTFPWLEYIPAWLPGATWKGKASTWRKQKDEMLRVPFEWTKNRMCCKHG